MTAVSSSAISDLSGQAQASKMWQQQMCTDQVLFWGLLSNQFVLIVVCRFAGMSAVFASTSRQAANLAEAAGCSLATSFQGGQQGLLSCDLGDPSQFATWLVENLGGLRLRPLAGRSRGSAPLILSSCQACLAFLCVAQTLGKAAEALT